jgi:formate dehydrogenase iron-sulfur subunit
MHCTEASCEKVCPTNAISHQGEAVIIDQEKCIGCGYCVQACPFHVAHKDEEGGTSRKCRFCIDRIQNGYQPACSKTCPTGAIKFGERGDLLAIGRASAQQLRINGYSDANLYGEDELGGLHTLYVLTERPTVLGLPEAPELATNATVIKWLSGIVTAGVVASVPLWLLFRRKKELGEEQETKVEGGIK